MRQLPFSFRTPPVRQARLGDPQYSPALREQFAARLQAYLDSSFRVRFNDNRSTVLSVGEQYGVLILRLHHMFIEADESVMQALADYVRPGRRSPQRKKAGLLLDGFIERNRHRIRSTPKGSRRCSLGRRYDLDVIRDALAKTYFDDSVSIPATWGVSRRRPGQRSVRLGSYSFDEGLIRIHPALDSKRVPPCVLVGVVYHEMLHHVLGVEIDQGRRRVHTGAFRARERVYIHHDRAEAWENRHLQKLMNEWNQGKS